MCPLEPLYTLGSLAKVTRLRWLRVYLLFYKEFYLSSPIHIRCAMCTVARGPWPAVGAASPLPCEPSPVGFQ